MSNRTASRQHGLHRAERMRAKTIWRKRKNKRNNRFKQQQNQALIAQKRAEFDAKIAA